MTLAAWPAGVRLSFNEADYRERPERNVDAFQVDHGGPLENRAQSIPSIIITGTIPCASTSEYDDLIEFYSDTLLDGVLHFTRSHPRTGASDCEFKFEDTPQLSRIFGDLHEVSVVLRYYPGIA